MKKYISIQNLIDAENEAVQEYNELIDKIKNELKELDYLAIANENRTISPAMHIHKFNMLRNRIDGYLDKSKELEKEIAELRMNLKTVLLPYV